MNTFATISARLIACCLLLAYLTAGNVTAQVIVPPPDFDPTLLVDLPWVFNMDTDEVDWDEDYTFFPFEGAALERVGNPDKSGGNTTDYVLKYVKAGAGTGGQPWAGFFYHTDEAMELTDDSRFTLNVWSPRANINALLKLEMRQFPDVNTGDIVVNIPVANEWVTLEWDLSANQNWRDTPFDRVVVIMDLPGGVAGDGGDNFTWYLDDFAYTDAAVSSENPGQRFPVSLYQNFPNPVSSATSITFSISNPGHAVVEVFDVLGQRVATLVEGSLPAGQHETSFVASDLPAGTYFYRLQVGNQVKTRKLTVIN
jgi:hypothetical protein